MATFDDDVLIRGRLIAAQFTPPAGSIGDAAMDSGSPIAASKQVHQYCKQFAQVHGSNAAAERRTIHYAYGAGTLTDFKVGSVVKATGDSTTTVNLYKNGSTILTAPIVLDSANTNFIPETAAFSTAAYSAGDVFEIVETVSAGSGTLPQGVFANLVVHEAAL